MTRYSGNTNSKSINARRAEVDGRYPATQMAAELRRRGLFRGVTPAAITAAVTSTEWHHSGSFAAEVNYYSLGDIYGCRLQLRSWIAAHRHAARAPDERLRARRVEWLEWSGTRSHPRAIERSAEDIEVTLRGNFSILHLPSGDMRKLIGARGFRLMLADGRVL